MAMPDLGRSFLEILVESGIEAIHLGDGGGEGEGPVMAPGLLPIEQAQDRGARRLGIGLHMLPGAIADRHDREARGAAQAFAGAGDEDVGGAILGMDVHAGEGGDGIDDQETAGVAHDLADLARRVDGAGRRIVMDEGDDLDVRPLAEGLGDGRRIDGLVIGHLDLHQLLVVALGPIAEALAIDARGEVEHDVVGPDEGGRGRLDARGRLAVQDQRRFLDLQRLGRLLGHILVELLKIGVVVVMHRPAQRAQNARIGGHWSRGKGDDWFLAGRGCHGGSASPSFRQLRQIASPKG